MKSRSFFSIALMLFVAAATLWSADPTAQESTLLPFEIRDQFDRVHRASDYEGLVLVMVGGDKGGAEFTGKWSSAIAKTLPDSVSFDGLRFVGVANLRGVPGFLRGTIRKKFPTNKDAWTLMDWKGILAKAYGWQPKNSNVVVFDRQGTLVHHAYGREVEDDKVDAIVAEIVKALDDGVSANADCPDRRDMSTVTKE